MRVIYCVILALFILVAIFYNLLPLPAYNIPVGNPLVAPNTNHLLGTDDLGMDILSQLLHGTRTSIVLGLLCAIIAGVGGSIIGVIAGYYGGLFDKIVLTLIDVVMVIPELPFMIVLSAFLGPSLYNIVIAISLLSWVMPAKMVRSQTLAIKNEGYMIIAQNYGASFPHIFRKHLLPGLYSVMVISFIRITNRAILSEAGLAFLGLSDPVSKSWGMVMNRAISFDNIFLTHYWKWWLISPIVFLVLFVFAISGIARELEGRL